MLSKTSSRAIGKKPYREYINNLGEEEREIMKNAEFTNHFTAKTKLLQRLSENKATIIIDNQSEYLKLLQSSGFLSNDNEPIPTLTSLSEINRELTNLNKNNFNLLQNFL